MRSDNQRFFIPVAAIAWLIVAGVLLVLSNVEFSLNDEEVWPDIVAIPVEKEGIPEDQLLLNIGGGGYFYDGRSQRLSAADTEEFLSRFEGVDIIEEIVIAELDRAYILLREGVDAQAFADNLTVAESVDIAELNTAVITLVDTASAEMFITEFGPIRQVLEIVERRAEAAGGEGDDDPEPQLIVILDERANVDAFATRFGNFEGVNRVETSQLSRVVASIPESANLDEFVTPFEDDPEVESVRTEPFSRLVITAREGANPQRIIDRIENELNAYFPIAGLDMDLWLPTLSASSDTILRIRATDTLIPLFLFALFYAGIELALAYYFFTREGEDKLLRPLVRALGVFLLFWSVFGHEPFWDYLLAIFFPQNIQFTSVSSGARVVNFVGQHLELVIISSFITIPLGLALGIFVTRSEFREFLPLVNNVVNSAQTVPTLAIVAIMVPILGPGFWPAVIALILYGLLPVVRNTIVGLESVDSAIIDAAKGMGLTPTQILIQIEIPIASRIIMAGIRTSTVVNIGTATLGAFVGSGGLGFPIQSGISMVQYPFVFLGAIPAALLAILVDYVLGRVEYVITPRGLQIEQ
ncbi:MAG: ABC transporter permease [Chloroflexota bacterium]